MASSFTAERAELGCLQCLDAAAQVEGLIASQLGNVHDEYLALEDGTLVSCAEYIRIQYGYKWVLLLMQTSCVQLQRVLWQGSPVRPCGSLGLETDFEAVMSNAMSSKHCCCFVWCITHASPLTRLGSLGMHTLSENCCSSARCSSRGHLTPNGCRWSFIGPAAAVLVGFSVLFMCINAFALKRFNFQQR